jgi:gluconolactonase
LIVNFYWPAAKELLDRYPSQNRAYWVRTKGGHMQSRDTISRRKVLKMVGMAGGLAMAASLRNASAQAATSVELLDPGLDRIISTSEPIRELATGFGSDLGYTEGPLWWKEGGYLLFSDIGNNRRIKYTPGQGTSIFKEPTNRANGLTRDLRGRLLACEHDTRRVTREETDGKTTVVANEFQGLRLNRPNDVIVKSDGSIYFTDPFNRPPAPPDKWDQKVAGVYRVSPDLSNVSLLVDNFLFPNGLAFSPDESVLYINDSRRRSIYAFDVSPNGLLNKQTERLFADVSGPESGGPDGMKVDTAGNVYCGGAGGIWIMNAKGKQLGRIIHGQPNTTNIAFGGDDWKTLYFTSRTTLGEVKLKIAGLPVPPRQK